jgi:hypothetical protein
MAALKKRLMDLPRLLTIERSEFSSIDGLVELLPNQFRCAIKTDKFNRVFANTHSANL